jgi:hypothetical protein
MKNYYFTFGAGSPLAKYYVKIQAQNELAARALMICMFSRHWSYVYQEEDFLPQINQYNLLELHVNRQCGTRLGTNREMVDQDIYNTAYTSGEVVCV